MSHPTKEVLLAHVDDELAPSASGDVARHVAMCVSCRAAIAELRETTELFGAVLRAVDATEPAGSQNATPARRGRTARPQPLPTRQPNVPTRSASRGTGAWRWAAAGLLLSAAAAAATLATRSDGFDTTPPAATGPAASPGDAQPGGGGAVVVRAAGGHAHIALGNVGAGSHVDIFIEDRADVRIAVRHAQNPRFIAAEGRVDVDARGERAALAIQLPRSIAGATVTLDAMAFVSVRGGTATPARGSLNGVTFEVRSAPAAR